MTVNVNSYRNATQYQIRSQCQHKDNTCENKTETTSAAEPESGGDTSAFPHISSEMPSVPQQNCHAVLLWLWNSGAFSNSAVAQLTFADSSVQQNSHLWTQLFSDELQESLNPPMQSFTLSKDRSANLPYCFSLFQTVLQIALFFSVISWQADKVSCLPFCHLLS